MKVTIKGCVHAQPTRDYDSKTGGFVEGIEFAIWPCDMSGVGDSGRVFISEQEFTVEVPDGFDIRAGMVENLEREKRKAAADYQRRVTELNAQIQSLLAIEA